MQLKAKSLFLLLPTRVYVNLDNVRFETDAEGQAASVTEAVIDLRGRLRLTFYTIPHEAEGAAAAANPGTASLGGSGAMVE